MGHREGLLQRSASSNRMRALLSSVLDRSSSNDISLFKVSFVQLLSTLFTLKAVIFGGYNGMFFVIFRLTWDCTFRGETVLRFRWEGEDVETGQETAVRMRNTQTRLKTKRMRNQAKEDFTQPCHCKQFTHHYKLQLY